MRVEADFESFVVVRVDAKTGNETVYHQIDVLIHVGLAARKRFPGIEQQDLRTRKSISFDSLIYSQKSFSNL